MFTTFETFDYFPVINIQRRGCCPRFYHCYPPEFNGNYHWSSPGNAAWKRSWNPESFLIFVWFSFFFLHIQYSEWMIFLHQLFIYPFKRVGIKYCWDSTMLLSKTNGSAQVALTRFFWLGRKTLPLLGWVSRKCSRGCIQYVWKGSLICLWKRWTYRLKGQHFHHGRWSNSLDHLREKLRQENLKTRSQAGSLWAEFGLVKCSLQDWVIIVHFSWLVDSILFTKVPSTLALVEEYKIYMCHFIFAVLVAYSPIVINIPFEKRDDPSPS